ncbi:BglG family transcription antiterminator [Thermoanaerobacterium sp. DL9XJH110]|uniref:BglG family transcription antiterminator n=1 Tax=Thermoanaerobacterium sp. DL9XJH110 TaxID=3386643 RepID=UPI003BB7CD42
MNLKKRAVKILQILLQSTEPLTIRQLGTYLNVSERTVQNDLNQLDYWLSKNDIGKLIRKPNIGIAVDRKYKDKILEKLSDLNYYIYQLAPEERKKLIVAELLRTKECVKINELADKMFVSRNTVISDLADVKNWLKKFNLQVKYITKKGIKVVGEEKDLRRALVESITENMNLEEIVNILDYRDLQYKTIEPGIAHQLRTLVKDIDVSYIRHCVEEAERRLGKDLSDMAFSGLIIHIAIAIKRISVGREILMPREKLKQLMVEKEFIIALQIAEKLEKRFGLKIPIEEVGYITLHLLGGKVTRPSPEEEGNWVEVSLITSKLISHVGKLIHVDLSFDEILFNGLKEHLKPALYRMRNGLSIKNPLLNEVKKEYPEIFSAVEEACLQLKDKFQSYVMEDEVAYIAMHFGAAIERLRNNRKVKAVIVCSTGMGTARLLASRLNREFENILVTKITSYHCLNEEDLKENIIISTIPLKYKDIPCIHISPLLNEKDKSRLMNFLSCINLPVGMSEVVPLNSLLSIIRENCQIIDYRNLVKALVSFFENHNIKIANRFYTTEEALKPVLKDVLKEENILLNVKVSDWQEAIDVGGNLLLKNGYIEEKYISAMKDAVRTLGPYIVIAPGIAMPHARPEMGAKKIGMSLITLTQPVNFGHPENDPVKIVVCLCSTDSITHLKALSQLMQFLDSKDVIELLREKNADKKLLIKYINNFSEKEE